MWRHLWLALAETQKALGLAIPDNAISEMRAHLDTADLQRVAEHERRLRHDVMAHIHAFGDDAPAARPFLHLGATSAFVTDNADLIVMRSAMTLLLGRLVRRFVGGAETRDGNCHRRQPESHHVCRARQQVLETSTQ